MKKLLVLGLFLIGSTYFAVPARADFKAQGEYTVTCQSEERFDYQTCEVEGEGLIVKVEIAEEFSDNQCEFGYSWSYNLDNIWVNHGCKARFTVTKDFRAIP
jgi:hypothetical protein